MVHFYLKIRNRHKFVTFSFYIHSIFLLSRKLLFPTNVTKPEDYCLLGCAGMWSGTQVQLFQSIQLSLSSG
jgi:hypothetical protein